jgi:hypothetical protein
MTPKLLAAAAGLALVATSPVLLGALVPALGVVVAVEAAWLLRRARRHKPARRSLRHSFGA